MDVLAVIQLFVAFAIIVISILTLVGFLNRFWYIFDIASQFRVQYCLGLVPLAITSALIDKTAWTWLASIMALCNLIVMLPLFIHPSSITAHTTIKISVSSDPHLGQDMHYSKAVTDHTLIIANVLRKNRNYPALLDLIFEYDPDLIALVEPDHAWLKGLSRLEENYPFNYSSLRSDNYGLAAYSKFPILQNNTIALGQKSIPTLVIKLPISDNPLSLIVTHPPPPRSQQELIQREKHLAALAALIRECTDPVILCGDLNVAPWSQSFRNFEKSSGLVSSSRGYGFQPSWPAGRLWMGVPIDHCLASPAIKFLERKILRPIGSDHLPLFVTFTRPIS